MPMTSRAFLSQLAADLARALDGRYRLIKSRLELRSAAPNGHDVIILLGATKYSPLISVEFYFGKNFAPVKRIEQRMGLRPLPYHVQQLSLNRKWMHGLSYAGPFTWSVNIEDPQESLATELAEAVHGMALPFFERFQTMEAARDAIADDDPWCFGGRPFWHQLLLLDMALNDLAHFEQWRGRLHELEQDQASAMIRAFEVTA